MAETSSREWNYHPDFPIDNNPLFAWPPRPLDTLKYYRDSWLTLSEGTLFLAMAWVAITYMSPDLATTATLDWTWAGGIYLRNLATLIVVAGGLHYYFYRRRGQQTELKYTSKFLHRPSERFLFNNQLYDNMFYTLVSGALIWSAYEVLMFWAMGNGMITLSSYGENPIWTFAALPLISLWISFHFYLNHRILHFKPLYDRFHALHHRNVDVGPFSGISMHPVEHVLYFSSVLIHFVVPTDPMHVIFHFYMLALSAVFGHTGFDALLVKNKRRIALGHFHHQLHHRYFECNYGAVDMPWDVLFGTFHDGTPDARKKMMARIRKNQT
ncbi:MAG: sterol desaturase family protein [Alphaproteobacteria bacterium]|nr:sterol desaturase family protein [Alphaproteobacteria bacterium]